MHRVYLYDQVSTGSAFVYGFAYFYSKKKEGESGHGLLVIAVALFAIDCHSSSIAPMLFVDLSFPSIAC